MITLQSIYAALGGDAGTCHDVTYSMQTNNAVLQVLQTPNLWGTEPDSTAYYTRGQSPGTNLVQAIQQVVQNARSVVDIATLAPFPDGAFADAISTGLRQRSQPNSPLLVRVHAGLHPGLPGANTFGAATVQEFVQRITSGLAPAAPVTVAVSMAMMSLVHASWNHGKVVAADGQQVIFGGHNMWAGDYLGYAPVHDISLLVSGPAAATAHVFCDQLWGFVGQWYTSANPATRVWSLVWHNGQIASDMPPQRPAVAPNAAGDVRAIPLAKLGVGIVNPVADGTDQVSNLAKVAAFRAAETSIKLSQQDLAFSVRGTVNRYVSIADSFDDNVVAALGGALDRGVDVYIVLSGEGARSATGNPYANMGGKATKRALIEWFSSVDGMTAAKLSAMLSHLHMAELHTVATNFNPWKQSADERVMANHAKCYIVDDAIAYVGSDNLYPCSLMEYGMMIEEPAAIQALLASYWTPLWTNAHPVP